eukprot:Skav234886  [mRNA]  locus=scaffold840:511207:511849:- [translate_table: standard]
MPVSERDAVARGECAYVIEVDLPALVREAIKQWVVRVSDRTGLGYYIPGATERLQTGSTGALQASGGRKVRPEERSEIAPKGHPMSSVARESLHGMKVSLYARGGEDNMQKATAREMN